MRRTNFNYTRTPDRARTPRSGMAGIVSALIIAMVMLVALVLPAFTRPSAALLLTAVTAVFALGASASLVNLVISDVRERVRVRRALSSH